MRAIIGRLSSAQGLKAVAEAPPLRGLNSQLNTPTMMTKAVPDNL